MKRQSNDRSQILESMKSCFQELELSISDEDDGEDAYVISSEIDFDLFFTRIHAAFFSKHDIIEIEINFLPPVNEGKLEKVYDLINRINTRMMDIGTFSIYPMGNTPSLRTAIYVPDKRFDSEQFKETLKRLITQGSHFHELIGRANLENVTAEEIFDDFVELAKELVGKQDNCFSYITTDNCIRKERKITKTNRTNKILGEMQNCFQKAKLPLMEEREKKGEGLEPDRSQFYSWCKNESGLAHITGSFFPEHNVVELSITNGERIPESIWPNLCVLFNLINRSQPCDHWIVCPNYGKIIYRSAMLVTGDGLNSDQFQMLLKRFLKNGSRFYPLIEKQMGSDERPRDLVYEFRKNNPDLLMGEMSLLS